MNNTEIDTTPNCIDENIESWDNEECLMNFYKFLGRVKMAAELVPNEDGAFVGRQINLICGDLMIQSDVVPLDWPLIMAPLPDDYQATIH